MKTRNGFVSNSSSSSFILSTTPRKKDFTITIPIDSLGEMYKTFDEWFKDNDWYDESDDVYKKVKSVFDSGKIIIEKSVDYGGEESFLDMINKIKDITLENRSG